MACSNRQGESERCRRMNYPKADKNWNNQSNMVHLKQKEE